MADEIENNKDKANYGFDVISLEFVDLVEKGIIDPAKVTKSALQNAVSVALMILTADALVADEPEPKDSKSPVMPQGGMEM